MPATPAELDAAWLTVHLAPSEAFRGVRILHVETRVIGVGYGLDGVLARLALETDGGTSTTPASLVAKLAPGERGRDEIAFYERIAPGMPIRLPHYHAGYLAADGGRAVLLLEDLTGAVQGDAVAGADRAQSEAVVRAMARFHAAFDGADHAALAGLRRWPGRADGLATRLEDRMPRFLERYEACLDERARDVVGDLARRLPPAVGLLAEAPPTLVHSDLHADNVLFLEPDVPVILDWPDACRGPALIDVVRFLVEGAGAEVRRRHGRALLAAYEGERARAGVPLPSRARAMREVEAAVTWHLAHTVAWAGAEDPGFGTPRVRAIVDTLVRSATAAALDLRPRITDG